MIRTFVRITRTILTKKEVNEMKKTLMALFAVALVAMVAAGCQKKEEAPMPVAPIGEAEQAAPETAVK